MQVISLAQLALAYTRSWAANSPNERIRLAGQAEQLQQEAALLREELRIKDARMARIPASKRPHYEPTERLAILEVRAARCWSLERTAQVFQVSAATIASWGKKQPTSKQTCRFLRGLIGKVGTAPKYLITDSGTQFTSLAFQNWCERHGVKHRKGAIGQTGSIAVCERFIRTLKDGCTRVLGIIPLLQRSFRRELSLFFNWYNQDRPHMTLKGATPDEIYFNHRPANRSPRFEPRPNWPRGSPCAKPQTLVKGQPGVVLEMKLQFTARRRHLPCVKLNRAA